MRWWCNTLGVLAHMCVDCGVDAVTARPFNSEIHNSSKTRIVSRDLKLIMTERLTVEFNNLIIILYSLRRWQPIMKLNSAEALRSSYVAYIISIANRIFFLVSHISDSSNNGEK